MRAHAPRTLLPHIHTVRAASRQRASYIPGPHLLRGHAGRGLGGRGAWARVCWLVSQGSSRPAPCLNNLSHAPKGHRSARCHQVPGTTPPSTPVGRAEGGYSVPFTQQKRQAPVQKRPPPPDSYLSPAGNLDRSSPACHMEEATSSQRREPWPLGMAGSHTPHPPCLSIPVQEIQC